MPCVATEATDRLSVVHFFLSLLFKIYCNIGILSKTGICISCGFAEGPKKKAHFGPMN